MHCGTQETVIEQEEVPQITQAEAEAYIDPLSLPYDEVVIPEPHWEVEKKDWDEIIPPEMREPDTSEVDIDEMVMGYRVQIGDYQNPVQASEIQTLVIDEFEEQVYLEYDAPFYKIRIGDCLSRWEAETLQEVAVRKGYRSAWVVRTMVYRYADLRKEMIEEAKADSLIIDMSGDSLH